MFYDFSFTIPANTSKYPLYIKRAKLTHGIIHRVEIGFPDGCGGLVHLRIKRGLFQVWPLNPDGDFNSDNYTIAFNDFYELFSAPYLLTLHGWNLDDAFPHTLEIRFGILPADVLQPEEPFIQAFKKLLKRLRL
ncbi:hypothetical protein ES708_02376 [subsurface metagenome]